MKQLPGFTGRVDAAEQSQIGRHILFPKTCKRDGHLSGPSGSNEPLASQVGCIG